MLDSKDVGKHKKVDFQVSDQKSPQAVDPAKWSEKDWVDMAKLIYPGAIDFPQVLAPGSILYDPKVCADALNRFSLPVFNNLNMLTTDHLCRNLCLSMG